MEFKVCGHQMLVGFFPSWIIQVKVVKMEIRASVYTLKHSFEDCGVMIVTHVLFKAFSRAFISMGCSPLKINLP